MSIIVCGINHKTAPLALREQAIFPMEKLALYLSDLQLNENIQEAVILSTCNRSEVYCDTDDSEKLIEWFCRQHQLTPQTVAPLMTVLRDQAAIEHIMHVACGLDSMVLGESQVLGQMKEAFSESCAAGVIGPQFNRLFQQVFSVAKDVRTHTAIGACPVSVASTAVSLAKRHFPQLNEMAVLVIGAGDTVNLVLQHLKKHAVTQLLIANRNHENAIALANEYQAKMISFDELSQGLVKADLVISATGSLLPVVSQALMQTVMVARKNKPITLIDIAVPRDVEASVAALSDVSLYCIDDLKEIIQHNLQGREHAADKAREVIQQKTQDFLAWQKSLSMVSTTIKAYRSQIEEMCQLELMKAMKQLQQGDDPAEVMAGFAHAFTNKLLHAPSVQLRQAGYEGRFDILQFAQQLFAIPHIEPELL